MTEDVKYSNIDGNLFGNKNFQKTGGDFRKPNYDNNNDRKFNSYNEGFRTYNRDNNYNNYNRTQEGGFSKPGFGNSRGFDNFPRSTYNQ